jgi:26S proteasome regulatory subunit N7
MNQIIFLILEIASRSSTHLISIATLERTHLLPSRLLSPHTRHYVREMRILAYSQLLESYRSLTLESLSGAFGLSKEFVDK